MIKAIKDYIRGRKVNKAIEQACKLREQSGKKYLVIMLKGEPRVFSKEYLKLLIRLKRFKKGTYIQDLEKIALFITK